MDKPLISIVTVTYNDADNLEETIISINKQTYKQIEFIIIDGGSTDRTLEILKSNRNKIDFFSSEKDEGVYNAMNKSLNHIKGEYVIFMNSGDVFYNDMVLDNVFSIRYVNNYDFVYGNSIIKYDFDYSRLWKSFPIDRIWKGMVTSHQSIFIKTTVMQYLRFNEGLKICSDYDMLLRGYLKNYSFINLPIEISIVTANGLSDKKRFQALREIIYIVRSHNSELKYRIYHSFAFLNELIRTLIKRVFPSGLRKALYKIKYNFLKR